MGTSVLTSPYHPSALGASRSGAGTLAIGQHVETPDGTAGRIIGFYRSQTPTALVDLDGGGLRQFLLNELRP